LEPTASAIPMTICRPTLSRIGRPITTRCISHARQIALSRLKDIASQKLARPETGNPSEYEHLQPILSKPIDWELIKNQYDEMIKYATALRLGTAETEAILRRFTDSCAPNCPMCQCKMSLFWSKLHK